MEYLSLDDISYFDMGIPDLYDKLSRLNVKTRNTFSPGKTQKQLRLITPDQLETSDSEDFGLGLEDDHHELEDDPRSLDMEDDQQQIITDTENDIISGKGHQYNLRSKKALVNLTNLARDYNKPTQKKSILKYKDYDSLKMFVI